MTEEFYNNVSAAAAAASSTVLNDLGALSGINPAYAQAYAVLFGGYLNAKASTGQGGTQLDTYAIGVIGGLAALLTTDPRQGAACFEDIAAWAIGGSAHVRTALNAQKQAQDAAIAKEKAQDPTVADRELAKRVAALNRAAMNAAPLGSKGDEVTRKLRDAANADPLPEAQPQDPREAAPSAYTGAGAQDLAD